MKTPVCERHKKPMTPMPVVQKHSGTTDWTCLKCEREWLIALRTKRPRPPRHG